MSEKNKRDKIEAEDITILYDLAWNQLKEDRKAISEQYADLKQYIAADNQRYAFNGDTLAKYAELLVKQTAQVLELIKMAHEAVEEDGTLSREELEDISKEIENDRKDKDSEK